MIIGPRMILLHPWKIDGKHTVIPGSSVIFVRKIDFPNDMAEIDVTALVGSGTLDIISVPISEMRKYLALE